MSELSPLPPEPDFSSGTNALGEQLARLNDAQPASILEQLQELDTNAPKDEDIESKRKALQIQLLEKGYEMLERFNISATELSVFLADLEAMLKEKPDPQIESLHRRLTLIEALINLNESEAVRCIAMEFLDVDGLENFEGALQQAVEVVDMIFSTVQQDVQDVATEMTYQIGLRIRRERLSSTDPAVLDTIGDWLLEEMEIDSGEEF